MNAQQHAPARRATVIGLVAGAVGIAILYVSGVAMPVVPPGLVLLVVAAIVVATVHRRWATAFGALVGVAEITGFFASGSAAALTDAGAVGVLAGTWIRLIGTVLATLAGIWATSVVRPAARAERS